MELFTNIAYAALALLVAVLAIYFTLRVMGKIAKFIVTIVILVAVGIVLWMIFSDGGVALPFVGELATVFGRFKH